MLCSSLLGSEPPCTRLTKTLATVNFDDGAQCISASFPSIEQARNLQFFHLYMLNAHLWSLITVRKVLWRKLNTGGGSTICIVLLIIKALWTKYTFRDHCYNHRAVKISITQLTNKRWALKCKRNLWHRRQTTHMQHFLSCSTQISDPKESVDFELKCSGSL